MITDGLSFDAALKQAQELGYAEFWNGRFPFHFFLNFSCPNNPLLLQQGGDEPAAAVFFSQTQGNGHRGNPVGGDVLIDGDDIAPHIADAAHHVGENPWFILQGYVKGGSLVFLWYIVSIASTVVFL